MPPSNPDAPARAPDDPRDMPPLRPTRLEQIAAGPAAHTLSIALTIASGIIANKYFEEVLRSVTPRRGYFQDDLSPACVVFVLFAAVIVVQAWFAQRARNKEEAYHRRLESSARDALLQSTDQLRRTDEQLIGVAERTQDVVDQTRTLTDASFKLEERLLTLTETLPPETLLREFVAADQRVTTVMVDFLDAARDTENLAEDARAATRVILENIVRLAMEFDAGSGRNPGVNHQYGCNYMQFLTMAEYARLAIDQKRHVLRTLKYADSEHHACVRGSTTAGDVLGVLYLHHDIAITFGQDKQPVADVKESLALCVPTDARLANAAGVSMYRAPAGAVVSFVDGLPFHVHSPQFAIEWLEQHCCLSQPAKDAAIAFHRDANNAVRSYFCAPVVWRVDDDRLDRIGVLNIHSNAERIFSGRDTTQHLTPLLVPLLEKLGRVSAFLEVPSTAVLEAHAQQVARIAR